METGGANPLKSIRAMRTMIAPVIMAMAEDAYAACRDADALICLGVFSAFGRAIAEALGIAIINMEPTPLLPTRLSLHRHGPSRRIGGAHNYLSGLAMLAVTVVAPPFREGVQTAVGVVAPFRRRSLPRFRSTPLLARTARSVIPHPADWPDGVHVTGYFFWTTRQTGSRRRN